MFIFASLPNKHRRRRALLSYLGDKAACVEVLAEDEKMGRSQDKYKQEEAFVPFSEAQTPVYVNASAGVYCLDLAFFSVCYVQRITPILSWRGGLLGGEFYFA